MESLKTAAARLFPLVLCLAAGAAPARGQATFQGLGRLPGATETNVRGVSADGSAAIGFCYVPGGARAFRWTRADGLVNLGVLAGDSSSQASAVSGDGRVVVGPSSTQLSRAFRWDPVSGMQNLWDWRATALAVNADGSAIIGLHDSTVFRWTSAGGVVNLGTLGSFPSGLGSSQVYGASADASVVVGMSDVSPGGVHPFRWTSTEGLQDLGTLPGGNNAWGTAVSGDGSVIVGFSDAAIDHRDHAWRWTAAGGMTSLGTLPGVWYSRAWKVNGDGSAIVGDLSTGHGFLWNTTIGMVDLMAYLPSLGVDLSGWTLQDGFGISADGLTIVGHGIHAGYPESWIATIPPPQPCYANCDGSTISPILNAGDFLCFLNRFAAGDAYANCDGSTTPPVINAADFACFLNRFAAGCT